MTTMTDTVRYIVTTPEEEQWLVTVGADGVVTYASAYTAPIYWHDEDEVVDAIESGLVNDEAWRDSHSDGWEA